MTSDERARQLADNEALYRKLNERVEDLNTEFAPLTRDFVISCECADLHCMDQISVSTDSYERARSSSTWFIVKSGHEAADIERIVERPGDGTYVLIEKVVREARRIADATDPRSP